MKQLTARQREDLKALMKARTDFLAIQIHEEQLASGSQHCRDLAEAVADSVDEAAADAIIDLETEFTDRHVTALRDINAAFDRIQDQTYGVCIDCDEAIPYERLTAYPTAQCCVNSQQLHEHAYPRPRTPMGRGRGAAVHG